MWFRHRRPWRFGVFAPFGFYFQTGFGFPSRSEYLRLLEEYKQDLEEELRAVEQEIAELKRESTSERA
jgi:hypothetical protein